MEIDLAEIACQETGVEKIVKIAGQRLDTYKAELYALLYMDEISKIDLLDAMRNMRKLADDIEKLLEEK